MSYATYIARLIRLLRDPLPPRLEPPSRLAEEPPRIVESPRQPEPTRLPRDEAHDKDFYLKKAADCRRQTATETDVNLKAELLMYAAEFEAKARKQPKP